LLVDDKWEMESREFYLLLSIINLLFWYLELVYISEFLIFLKI
jgi:hypothetical protein